MVIADLSVFFGLKKKAGSVTSEEIEQYLEQLKRIGDVTPAVVTGVEEQTVTVTVKGKGCYFALGVDALGARIP